MLNIAVIARATSAAQGFGDLCLIAARPHFFRVSPTLYLVRMFSSWFRRSTLQMTVPIHQEALPELILTIIIILKPTWAIQAWVGLAILAPLHRVIFLLLLISLTASTTTVGFRSTCKVLLHNPTWGLCLLQQRTKAPILQGTCLMAVLVRDSTFLMVSRKWKAPA